MIFFNSDAMRWILFKLFKIITKYVVHRFLTFNPTLNFSFSTLNSFKLKLFLLLCFMLEWGFLTLHRACWYTHACAHAHTSVYIHRNTLISRHSVTLKPTHTQAHSHLTPLTLNPTYTRMPMMPSNMLTLDLNKLTLYSNMLTLDSNISHLTRTHSHSTQTH